MRDERESQPAEDQEQALSEEQIPEDEATPEDSTEESITDELLEEGPIDEELDEPPEEPVEPGEAADQVPPAADETAPEPLEVPSLESIEAALDEPPVDRVPPLILVSAVIGLVVGLFVWGSLAISVMSSTGDVIDDFSADSEGAFDLPENDLVIDCTDAGPPQFASAEQRAAFAEKCASPTPAAAETPTPDPALNRADCDAIRGTPYQSADERQWFLDNCVEG